MTDTLRKTLFFLISAALTVWLAACSSKPIDRVFRWEPLGERADSLVLALDSAYTAGASWEEMERTLEAGEGMAGEVPERNRDQFRGRLYIWRTRIASAKEDWNRTYRCDSLARSLMDSAAWPYDHARLNAVKFSVYKPDFVRRHANLLNAISYGERTKDPFLQAEALVTLAEHNYSYDDIDMAVSLLRRAIDLYRGLGFGKRENISRMNLYLVREETDSLMALLEPMLNRETGREVSINHVIHAICRQDMAEMDSLLAMPHFPDGLKAWLMSSRLHMAAARADTRTVDSLVHIGYALARKLVDEGHGSGDKRYFNLAANLVAFKAKELREAGLNDSAFTALEGYTDMMAEYQNAYGASQSRQVTKAWMEEAQRKKVELERREHRTQTAGILIVALMLGMAALIVWLIMKRRVQEGVIRHHKAELESERLKAEINREQRKVLSNALIMTEKDNVLQTLLSEIDQMHRGGKLTQADAAQISGLLRTHQSSAQDWETFRMTFEKVHPSFTRSLLRQYPQLTEGDLKMAAYIKVGLSTKQISRMLLLTPGSVKLKRHRLREHMGLAPEVSLEDTLRQL